MKMKHWAILLAVLLLAGCGDEQFDDLQEFVKNSGQGMRGKIEPPPEVKPYEPFTYDNSAGLPDPFMPRLERRPAEHNAAAGGHAPPPHPKQELENYALESLKMVGYLYINGSPNAIIQTPDQKVHHVKVGNYIGLNFGQITAITETEVKIKEQVEDAGGNWTTRYSTLELLQQ
jgi:type IV pilus assembly protein PilP